MWTPSWSFSVINCEDFEDKAKNEDENGIFHNFHHAHRVPEPFFQHICQDESSCDSPFNIGCGACSCLVAVGAYSVIFSMAFVIATILYSFESSDYTGVTADHAQYIKKMVYYAIHDLNIIKNLCGRLWRRLIRTVKPKQLSAIFGKRQFLQSLKWWS